MQNKKLVFKLKNNEKLKKMIRPDREKNKLDPCFTLI